MLLTLSPQKALALLNHPSVIREDCLVPADIPACPNAPYRRGYEWLFVYERQIARFLSPWLSGFRYALIGEKGLLCEALSNAFSHGNGRDPNRPIRITVIRGMNGLIVRIRDDGPGFPVARVFDRFARKEKYFLTAGNGLRHMAASPDFGIYYNTAGTAFHLIRMFNGETTRLSPFAIGSSCLTKGDEKAACRTNSPG